MLNLNFLDIKENYLKDDGLARDIVVDLAIPMGFKVLVGHAIKNDTFAVTVISKNVKKIMINNAKSNNCDILKFILAYQLAEVIIFNQEELFCEFRLDFIDFEVYELAKKIVDRSNMYKRESSNLKRLNKIR